MFAWKWQKKKQKKKKLPKETQAIPTISFSNDTDSNTNNIQYRTECMMNPHIFAISASSPFFFLVVKKERKRDQYFQCSSNRKKEFAKVGVWKSDLKTTDYGRYNDPTVSLWWHNRSRTTNVGKILCFSRHWSPQTGEDADIPLHTEQSRYGFKVQREPKNKKTMWESASWSEERNIELAWHTLIVRYTSENC